jgi:hypothetical protein
VRLKRTLTGLIAADEAATEAMRTLKIGDEIECEMKKARVHKNLRRWWGLCNLVHENSEQFRSPEMVHDFLKIRSGHCAQIVSQSTGEIYLIADSIAFGRMDEIRFQKVWKLAVRVVCEEIIPGLNSDEVELEILKCVGLAA